MKGGKNSKKQRGDLVVSFGNWDIPLFDENIVIKDDDTIFWKPGHVAVILQIKTLRLDQGRSRLVEVLTPSGIGWCYLSEAQKVR
jgi:hypothetical protein